MSDKKWYKNPEWIIAIIAIGGVLIGVGYILKDLDYLKKSYEKEILPSVKLIPEISSKTNEHTRNINFIAEKLKIDIPRIKELETRISQLRSEISKKNAQIAILESDLYKARSFAASFAGLTPVLDKEASKVKVIRGQLSFVSDGLNGILTDLKKPQPPSSTQIFQNLEFFSRYVKYADSELQKTSENFGEILNKIGAIYQLKAQPPFEKRLEKAVPSTPSLKTPEGKVQQFPTTKEDKPTVMPYYEPKKYK